MSPLRYQKWQGFYNLSDSAYSRMSGYTVKPPTGDTNEQTQFIDYFNLFYSKRGQEQISISQQLGKVPLGLSATYGQTGNKVSAGTVQSVIGVTFIYE